ncbi:MAG: class I SAM-dependent methyltransferase [Betaproteobacteria bacterium]|nr:MAG: class I SAM-dependent methyltransferase [Betaproteobacteria bacterium]
MQSILPEQLASPLPAALHELPPPDEAARAHMQRLHALVVAEMQAEGFMSFARFMELALYAPGLGYYAAGTAKFGAGGDYVTAPELSPLFGAAVAQQVAQCVTSETDTVIELGAGTGRMAADILRELERLERLPRSYQIIELSPELRARQHATLRGCAPALCDRVQWLERLPERIRGVVIGNEVLDALPVALVGTSGGRIAELGVTFDAATQRFSWARRDATGELLAAARELSLPDEYTTEVHLAARGLVRTIGAVLEHGIALFIDYGFPRHEYYHPQRSSGTLMCHYRHHSHGDPLCLVGLQDITSHLDFTALADAAADVGLSTLGYATQAHFLMGCGILDRLCAYDPQDAATYARVCAGVQPLLSPAEMGELFKVIAFGRGIDGPLLGFRSGNRVGRL